MLELPLNEREHHKNLIQLNYALYFASAFFLLPGFIAVTINFLKLQEVRGTWFESHYHWQIKTFWMSLAGSVIGMLTTAFLLGYLILLVTLVWVACRAVRGWLAFKRGQLAPG